MIPIGKIEYDREVYCVDGFKLPIEKRPVKISQGHHGPWSHCAFKIMYLGREIINDDTYSVDFEVPFNTPVFSSKDGEIDGISLSERFYEGLDFKEGMRTCPSMMVINHGEISSLYAHLGEIPKNIKRGYMVEKGQLIGFTGKSGWIGPTPHLHFEVFKKGRYLMTRLSLPCNFEDYQKSLEHSLL